MPITKIDIAAVEPFAEGSGFGEAGSYVRIHGVAKGELDPAAPRNAVIVDIDKAERNARGMVEYEIDLFVLRPADPRRGSGTLVYDVTNRGRKGDPRTARRSAGRRKHKRPPDGPRCGAGFHARARLDARLVRLGLVGAARQ